MAKLAWAVAHPARVRLLQILIARDACVCGELVDQIRRLMFVFDDLLKLDNRSIQALLKEVENAQWALALKGASEELKAKVLSNLSQRAAALLQEEMEYLGPVRVSDVEAMQQQIVDTVRRLEDSGEIAVNGGGGSDQMIG